MTIENKGHNAEEARKLLEQLRERLRVMQTSDRATFIGVLEQTNLSAADLDHLISKALAVLEGIAK